MVLYDPMERPLLQLVTSHPATSKKLFPRRAPRWAENWRELSDEQLAAATSFAQFAQQRLRGETGTEQYEGRQISRTAYLVATEYPDQSRGEGAFGGDTTQERRRQRHEETDNRINEMVDELDRREAARRGGNMAADGGQITGDNSSGE